MKVLDRDGRPVFDMCFYGLHAAELNLTPDRNRGWLTEYPTSGKEVIEYALRRRGLDPMNYICVKFLIEDIPQISGPRIKREYHRA